VTLNLSQGCFSRPGQSDLPGLFLCDAAYERNEHKLNRFDDFDLEVKNIEGARVVALSSNTELVFAYAGTDDRQDVINDVLAQVPKYMWEGKVCFGFWRHSALAHDWIEKIFNHFSGKNKIVSFYGHSLGGAAAALAAFEMTRRGKEVDRFVGFGDPDPGGWRLARYLRKTGIIGRHYVNENDPVPWMPFGYRKPFPKVYVDSSGTKIPNIGRLLLARKKAMSIIKDSRLGDGDIEFIGDHMISTGYWPALTSSA